MMTHDRCAPALGRTERRSRKGVWVSVLFLPDLTSFGEHNAQTHQVGVSRHGWIDYCRPAGDAGFQAEVSLAGRSFTIKKQFLDDLAGQYQSEKIARLKRALLVFHSPLDTTVSINEAEKIYRSAKHPKSFVSLDDADHLLTKPADAEYVATIIAAWATRYIEETDNIGQQGSAVSKGQVL